MKFNGKLKLVECSEAEKNLIEKCIYDKCVVVAADEVKHLILSEQLIWSVGNRQYVNAIELKDMCYNVVQAIRNNYKYLHIIK